MTNYIQLDRGTELPKEEGLEIGLDFHKSSGDNILSLEELRRQREEDKALNDVKQAFEAPAEVDDFERSVLVGRLVMTNREAEVDAQTAAMQSAVSPMPTNMIQFPPVAPANVVEFRPRSDIGKAA